MALGPIRLGQNKRWWTWDEGGVWRENPDAVKHRTIQLIPNKYRGSHAANAGDVVAAHAETLFLDHPDADYINFRNGMLHWRTGEVKDHDPSFLSTVQLAVNYNPDAACPKFDHFLDSVMSPAYVKLAWEMIGYLMFSGNPLQKAFLLHGTGGNGKGTLIRVIQALLGNENTSSVSLDRLNGSNFAPSALFGKIANLAGDIDGTFQESTATFKMLTGEDRISGEYKYGDSFTFACWAVPVFSANKIPGSADVSVGYLRRWVVLEFNKSFIGEPILNLSDQLETELEGIAAKALTFLGPLLDRAHFDVVGEASQGAEDFAMALDQVRQWADEWTHPAPGNQVPRDLLYARYSTWATANGAGKLRAQEFYSRLESAGYPHKKIKGKRVFCDIFLLDAERSTLPSMDEFFEDGR
jgi:P4 family phage/plasmid primase-like protien